MESVMETEAVEALAAVMEVSRRAVEKSESVGWRYRELHDDVLCARDEHGCGCLCHVANAILAALRADPAAARAVRDAIDPDGLRAAMPWRTREEVATPPGTRLILASENLLSQFGTRTEDGRRITAEWGERRPEGWYEPTFVASDDPDGPVPRANVIAALTFLRKHLVGTPPNVDGEDVWIAARLDDAETVAFGRIEGTPDAD